MKAVILAAGIGSRLGRRLPKPLTVLPSGTTILANQITLFRQYGINEIIIIVGFKKEIIMEEYSDVLFRYNPLYHLTNTSKSLMLALESIEKDDVVWINGDVYLDGKVIERISKSPGNVIAVNKEKCGEEEVKYKSNSSGEIIKISKKVEHAEGEAVGVNKISKDDFSTFLGCLRDCDNQDYFEMGIEKAISKSVVFRPIDISDCVCVEVDFKKDLEHIQRHFH